MMATDGLPRRKRMFKGYGLVGLLAAVALTVGFMPGASAAEPDRTAPTKPPAWDISQLPTGAGKFTTLCGGGCIQ
jgi:hypothetical protein